MKANNEKDKLLGKIIFNSFKIKKKLGEGSFGKVYVISNLKTKELFAAKLVNKKYIIFNILLTFRKNATNIMIF